MKSLLLLLFGDVTNLTIHKRNNEKNKESKIEAE